MFKDLETKDKKKYLESIKELEKILPDYDIYLQFGTLLGAIRGSKLPDFDNDIDVCYLSHYHTAEEVEQEIKDIYTILVDKGVLLKYFTREFGDIFWKEENDFSKGINKPFGQAYVLINGVCIDLFTSWIDELGNYFTCQWGNFGDAKQFFPVVNKSVYDIDLKVPQNSEIILERLYGDWRTPRDEKSHLERRSFLNDWLIKYSVIIPCYTPSESDFRRCLDYWKNQTIKPYEVIVVDDASPTNVPQIAKEYGFKYIRHNINKHNGGARNTGIKEATGDYLVFCNSDDYFELNTIEELRKVNKGQDLIIVGFSVFGTINHKDRFIPNENNTPNISQFNWNGEAMHIVNRKFILDHSLFEIENVPIADRDWTLQLEALNPTHTFVPKALYNYQWGHEGAIMTQIANKEIVNNLTNPEFYEQKKKENNNTNIDVLIYEHNIPELGGNVTSLINWVKHMHKYYNITVLYKSIFPAHKKLLLNYAKCVLYHNQPLETDILIWNSSWGEYPATITFKKEPIQILHANYKEVFKTYGFRYKMPKYKTKYVAVSRHVSEVFEEMYGIPSKVIYNMLDPDVKVEKVLRLVTCSRLTKEKGLDNILKFAEMLKKFNKKFIWFIYGSGNVSSNFKKYPEIILMGVSHDLPSYVADCDYMAHFSFTEGDPYCTKEALQVNTPCITTSYPATYEQITDGKNGYILDFDLFTKGTDEEWEKVIDKIYNKIPKFKYKNRDEEFEKMWLEELGKPIGELKPIEIPKGTDVEILIECDYSEEGKHCVKGEILTIEREERLKMLLDRGYVKLI